MPGIEDFKSVMGRMSDHLRHDVANDFEARAAEFTEAAENAGEPSAAATVITTHTNALGIVAAPLIPHLPFQQFSDGGMTGDPETTVLGNANEGAGRLLNDVADFVRPD